MCLVLGFKGLGFGVHGGCNVVIKYRAWLQASSASELCSGYGGLLAFATSYGTGSRKASFRPATSMTVLHKAMTIL